MQQHALSERLALFLEPPLASFRRALESSSGLRLGLLVLVNLVGCSLVLSPPIILTLACLSASYLLTDIKGPLDTLLVAVAGIVSLLAMTLSKELYQSRADAPPGAPVDKEKAPVLYAMLGRRLSHFKMPSLDHVVLTPGTELKIQAAPRFPIPFFHQYTLCIGAPILYFITPAQFRLALAGAVAASMQTRNSMTGWAVRLAEDWAHIARNLEQRRTLYARLFLPSVTRLASLSDRLSTGLCAQQQQNQSRWVLENTDESNASEFLAAHVVAESYLKHQYWPMIFKAAERCPTPVVKPFSLFEPMLDRSLNKDAATRWLLQAQVSREAEHTELRDLLAALGIDHLAWSSLPEHRAFRALFLSNAILKDLDEYWRTTVAAKWNQRHISFQNRKLRFETLRERAQQQKLSVDSALRYIELAGRFLDTEQAVSVYSSMYKSNRYNADVCYASGRKMLACGYSQQGCEALLRASELDSSLASRARKLIQEHKQRWLDREDGDVDTALSA